MTSVAEAFVEIKPDFSSFDSELRAGIERPLSQLSSTADDAFAGVEDAADSAAEAVADAFDDGASDAGNTLDEFADIADAAFDEVSGVALDATAEIEDAFSDLDLESAADDAASGASDALSSVGDNVDFSGVLHEASAMASQLESEMEQAGEDAGSALSNAFGSATEFVSDHMVEFGVGLAGTAAGGEALARSMGDTSFAIAQMSTATGLAEGEIRKMVAGQVNATRSSDDVIAAMSVLSKQGVDNADDLQRLTDVWDLVADATGENIGELASAAKALEVLGVSVQQPEDALDAFGLIMTDTIGGVGSFLNFVTKSGPEIAEFGLGIDEVAAAMVALERSGLTGERAQRAFRRELKNSDGDLQEALDSLGVAEGLYESVAAEVDGSSAAIEANAKAYADTRTPMQRFQATIDSLTIRFGGLGSILGSVTGGLAAAGPVLLGLTQAAPLLAKGLAGLRAGFVSLGTAILANPIFLVAAIIIGIGAAVWIFRDEIIGALSSVFDFVSDIFGSMLDVITGTWGSIMDVISSAIDFVTDVISVGIDLWVAIYIEFPKRVLGVLAALPGQVAGIFSGMFDRVRGIVTGGVDQIKGAFSAGWDFVSGVIDQFKAIPDRIWQALNGVYTAITSPFRNAFNFLVRAWNNTLGGFGISVPDIPGLPGRGKSFRFPTLDEFALGGIVTAPTLGLIGEAGSNEAIIPLDNRGREFMSQVIDLAGLEQRIAAAVAAAVMTQPTVVELVAAGGDRLMAELLRSLRQHISRSGGNVQVALGGGTAP